MISSLMLLLTSITSCSQFSDDTSPYDVSEPVKDLCGVWKLTSVTRNGVDISKMMDFSKFSLVMNLDGGYHIENYLPFVVKNDGAWLVSDRQYPLNLHFIENGQTQTTTVDINTPILDGERMLTIQLSPGCSGNTYTYILQRKP